MTIHQAPFGSYKGKAVTAFTLINANGLTARLISFGARLMEMHVPDRTGRLADIVLGFDDLASYAATDTYFGATVGRYGNRIKNGRFALEGEPLEVTRNEPPNHLHGGAEGFDRKVWDAYPNESETSVTFSLVSPSGEEGFPGQVSVTSKYTLTDDNRLVIVLSGLTDAPTILNMVHHSYWNVAGHDSGDICDQLLTVDADFYTPVDDELMPTGDVLTVKDSAFDFTVAKAIGRDLQSVSNAGAGRTVEQAAGYDHNWVLRDHGPGLRSVATLYDPVSGRGLSLKATKPGVQIYTGGYLSAAVIGKGRTPYCPYAGLTFETQYFPDSPNFAHFPTSGLCPGETYDHRMDIRFFTNS
jgi:aldose 1-epimerase